MFTIYLYLYGIVCVYYLNGGVLDTILFENNLFILDYWFLIHVFNNICIAKFYPKKLTKINFLMIPLGWEIIENIIIPTIGYESFRENWRDTMGDLLSIIPAYFIV